MADDEAMARMLDHLEFLGYETERSDDRLYAKHPTRPNITLKAFRSGVLHTSVWGCSDDAKRDDYRLHTWANRLSTNAAVVRYYLDDELDLFVEAWYPAVYVKADYARFIDNWDGDFGRFRDDDQTGDNLG